MLSKCYESTEVDRRPSQYAFTTSGNLYDLKKDCIAGTKVRIGKFCEVRVATLKSDTIKRVKMCISGIKLTLVKDSIKAGPLW